MNFSDVSRLLEFFLSVSSFDRFDRFVVDGYLEIFNDNTGALKSQTPIALDGDNDTCFALPVQGDTPPLFWTRMNTSVVLGISASQFDIVITGEGISCAKHSNNRVLQVK